MAEQRRTGSPMRQGALMIGFEERLLPHTKSLLGPALLEHHVVSRQMRSGVRARLKNSTKRRRWFRRLIPPRLRRPFVRGFVGFADTT
jgi:hypothetical protein